MMRRYWATDRIQQVTRSMQEAENEAKNEAWWYTAHAYCLAVNTSQFSVFQLVLVINYRNSIIQIFEPKQH